MKKTEKYTTLFITLLISIFIFLVGAKEETKQAPNNVYQVYLNGEVVGLLNSKDKFLDLINTKQQEIKNKYNIENVYPPSGLKIEKAVTYNENIKSPEEIYNYIKNIDPFTIDGYMITINYKDENKPRKLIYTLDKKYFETAIYNTMATFIGANKLLDFKDDTQEEIKDVGSLIESVYWDEDITIKKTRINTQEQIFTNEEDLSKYLLFGTLEEQESYLVKEGDTIASIINNNKLSIEEFLIANPSIPNENILLTANQKVSIGLIAPIVTIIHEEKVIEDIVDKYGTEYQEDSSLYAGMKKVIQEGSDGLNRVTEQILYHNGQIVNFVITHNAEMTPKVDEIIARGTKYSNSGHYVNIGNERWYWPTVSPAYIMSKFGYRWGSHHNGIDISGSGFGSPIRSATDGTVIEIHNSCPNHGYYGNKCGKEYGNYIKIKTSDDTYIVNYAHLTDKILVGVGKNVSRGQIIGYMGNSGSSTGTHLHFEIRNSANTPLDPCKVAYSC